MSGWCPRFRALITISALCLFMGLPAGCPTDSSGSSSDGTPKPPDTGSSTETDGSETGTTVDSADSATTDEVDGAAGPPGTGALLVTTLEDAVNTYFDVYQLPGAQEIRSYEESNVPIYLAAGHYDITQYYNASFCYAHDVTITAGNTTSVALGAIKLVPPAEAVDGSFDVYDATGATAYATYNAPNALITAPAGTFVLKEYANADFDYATGVTVVAGEMTTVTMGGIKLVTVAGAADGTYAICDSTGTTTYASYNDPDVIITAPAGTFTLKEYFNPDFTYAENVVVAAGAVTEVEMGAIRYNGTLAYDIYADGVLVASYNEAGLIMTAPAGTYTLTEYFDEENVLATNVVVTAGAVTDVP